MKIKVEDLIKIAKENNLVPKTNGINDVHTFILDLKIKEGQHRVKSQIIYEAYCQWTSKPKKFKHFCQLFSQFFNSKQSYHYMYYSLNYRPLELLNRVDNMKIKIK